MNTWVASSFPFRFKSTLCWRENKSQSHWACIKLKMQLPRDLPHTHSVSLSAQRGNKGQQERTKIQSVKFQTTAFGCFIPPSVYNVESWFYKKNKNKNTKKPHKEVGKQGGEGGSKAEEKEAIVALSTQQKYKYCLRKNNGNVTLVHSIKHLDMTSRGRQWFMWVICSK